MLWATPYISIGIVYTKDVARIFFTVLHVSEFASRNCIAFFKQKITAEWKAAEIYFLSVVETIFVRIYNEERLFLAFVKKLFPSHLIFVVRLRLRELTVSRKKAWFLRSIFVSNPFKDRQTDRQAEWNNEWFFSGTLLPGKEEKCM